MRLWLEVGCGGTSIFRQVVPEMIHLATRPCPPEYLLSTHGAPGCAGHGAFSDEQGIVTTLHLEMELDMDTDAGKRRV